MQRFVEVINAIWFFFFKKKPFTNMDAVINLCLDMQAKDLIGKMQQAQTTWLNDIGNSKSDFLVAAFLEELIAKRNAYLIECTVIDSPSGESKAITIRVPFPMGEVRELLFLLPDNNQFPLIALTLLKHNQQVYSLPYERLKSIVEKHTERW